MSTLITIPSKHSHLADLREDHEPFGSRICVPAGLELRHITAAGAFFSPAAGLAPRDTVWLYNTLLFCQNWDIPLTHDFQLTPVNLAKAKDQDILDPSLKLPPTDVFMCCMLINTSSDFGKDAIKNPVDDDAYLLSKLDSVKAWRYTPKRLDAKLVFSFSHSDSEICAKDLKTSDYILLATRNLTGPLSTWEVDILSTYTMDVLIQRNYLEELLHANPHHNLGECLQAPNAG